jgi:hypothetical protein
VEFVTDSAPLARKNSRVFSRLSKQCLEAEQTMIDDAMSGFHTQKKCKMAQTGKTTQQKWLMF